MSYLIIIGAITLVAGILFLFAPETLRSLNEKSKRMVSDFDATAFTHRIGLGITLIAASLLFFFVAYYVKVKG